MPENEVLDRISRAGISFIGTVKLLGAATISDVAVDQRTAVVAVDQVLDAPDALARLAGSDITVQLAANTEIPQPGQQLAFFTNPVAFGASLAVTEVSRLPVESVAPHVSAAMDAGLTPQLGLRRQLEDQRLRSHAADADAVVIGTVAALERVGSARLAEHDPDWWRATLDVHQVERGDLPTGEVAVLYANSLDVRWRRAPKPKAGQEGLWLLHATQGDQRELAPYVIPDPDDHQPVENLDVLRVEGRPR